MSGRDLKSFLTHRRSAMNTSLYNGSDLAKRFVGGQKKSTKYKNTDYDQLKELAGKYKQSGLESFSRVKKLSQINKNSKETTLLRQHSDVWLKESHTLAAARKSAQVELEAARAKLTCSDDEELKTFFSEMLTLEAQAYIEQEQFHQDTVNPILQLKDDLKYWIRQSVHCRSDEENYEHIKEELAHVKQQQSGLLKQIEEVYKETNDEIQFVLELFDSSYSDLNIEKGIPSHVMMLTWPYEELKDSVLKEFLHTDEQYSVQLDDLKKKYSDYLSDPYGGWHADEWLRLGAILGQYPPNLPNRRALYTDRLLREFPHKSRTEIVAHEDLYTALQYYKERKLLLLNLWQNERQELVVKVQVMYTDAWEEFEVHEKLQLERAQQQKLCKELYNKVAVWRKAKQEIMALEAAISAQLREEELTKRQEDELQKKQHRQHQKKLIETYHLEQRRIKENTLKQEQMRLHELQELLRVQVEKDKARIQYREEQHLEKLEEKRQLQSRLQIEEMEREKRLDKLRATVQVKAEVDPCRVLRETQSYQAKIDTQSDAELNLQAPLFKTYSFPTEKIEVDQRFKIANALTKAGLHNTKYARTILASVPPLKPPRPDQASSLFKDQ